MLARLFGDMRRDRVGRGEILAVGIAADHIAMMLRDGLPEEPRGVGGRGLAVQFVDPRQPDQLGYLRIGMKVRELVLARDHRIEHLPIVKPLRDVEPLLVPGPRGQFGIALV